MSAHVTARTDHGYCGWWCSVHEVFTGRKGWCLECDGPLAAWRDRATQPAPEPVEATP